MNLSVTDRFKPADAAALYGITAWGNGYLSIDPAGRLRVSPWKDPKRSVALEEVVAELARQGVHTPVVLRFPQLLHAQVRKLAASFERAIDEYTYEGSFQPVFPIKVNQLRPVVEALVEGGREAGLGLEVGSRAELLAAMAQDLAPESLLVCNGFKDDEYLESASLALQAGKRAIVVVEKPFELDGLLQLARRGETVPWIGFRIRLQARGSGLWEKSGGFASKFGLTTLQLLRSLERLEEAGLLSRVVLLHFHIGSQITEIRKVKKAVQEAGRVYAKLRKRGVEIRWLDVGGGLGVDYDGSKTSSDASTNYTVQEYANDVVFGVKEVCEQEEVPAPDLICESGRMLTAFHSVLVTDVRACISGVDPEPPRIDGEEHQTILDLNEVAASMTVKNYREYYHDAIDYRDQMYALFDLGMLGLEDRAKGEALFWWIAQKAVRHSKSAKFPVEEFVELESKLHDKYICNFSVFQSLPDHWALDQLFPVMPIHRLNEPPRRRAKLVDITCDSDGEVDKFIDLKDIKDALEVHDLRPGESYYLGFLLVGAYQDTMGDLHNLFGKTHQAQVVLDEDDGEPRVELLRRGDAAAEPLSHFGWDAASLRAGLRAALEARVAEGRLDAETAREAEETYAGRLDAYTYLGTTGREPAP